MFLEVGAEHVISIDEKKVIEDLAILSFTKTFYDRIWKTNSTICGAFHQAKTDVGIEHGPEILGKFKLDTNDQHACEDCPIFGCFKEGVPEFKEQTAKLRDMPPKILIEGRSQQQRELLAKLLSADASRE